MGLDRTLLLHLATSERVERAVKATPGGARAAWHAASRYVAGTTRGEALAVAGTLLASGHAVSIDLFGERVDNAAVADRAADEYLALAGAIEELDAERVWLSVDISHFAVRTDESGAARRLETIARALSDGRRIQVGAEDAAHADAIQRCLLEVAGRGLERRLGATIQANLLRSVDDVRRLAEAGIHIRLVKGAYVERVGAHPFGEPTDVAFLRLGEQLRAAGAQWSLASHDGRMREALLLAGADATVEQLFGVRPDVLAELHGRGIATRVYLPYGPDWFRYWARRVAESRGA
ncbi:MAG TPA: proline dehydrogenase family protein [Solirubrobacteraceae bacterium]|nr:proline dehydrogenase family protein [Solirubrobacteraceae bacterium]